MCNALARLEIPVDIANIPGNSNLFCRDVLNIVATDTMPGNVNSKHMIFKKEIAVGARK